IQKQRKAHGEPEVGPGDARRYNTVYARDPGSAASPTAGLHFTPELLSAIDARGVARAMVTLHVGMGTFAPVRTARVEDHPIHSEWIDIGLETISALARTRDSGGRVIPVGTTTVRALESLPADWRGHAGHPGHRGDTSLFITPEAAAAGRFA